MVHGNSNRSNMKANMAICSWAIVSNCFVYERLYFRSRSRFWCLKLLYKLSFVPVGVKSCLIVLFVSCWSVSQVRCRLSRQTSKRDRVTFRHHEITKSKAKPIMKTTASLRPTVIICPGNGCSNIRESNWYGQLYNFLLEKEIPCICKDFPDPLHARRDRWVPFMRSLAEQTKA